MKVITSRKEIFVKHITGKELMFLIGKDTWQMIFKNYMQSKNKVLK